VIRRSRSGSLRSWRQESSMNDKKEEATSSLCKRAEGEGKHLKGGINLVSMAPFVLP
jgi:hypothetical protein